MKKIRMILAALGIALCVTCAGTVTLRSASLGDKLLGNVLKGAAIAVLTNALADQLNDFINTVTLNKGVPPEAETKVVPILAFGSGSRVGAAQVTGPRDLVNSVKIVVQIETKFSAKNLDVEIFVPSDSINPINFNRVEGVGVSALIDLRLSGI